MKSFLLISIFTAVCFAMAGVSSHFVEEEAVEKTVNKELFKEHKYIEIEKTLSLEKAIKLDIKSFSEDMIFVEDDKLTTDIRINYYEVRDSKTDKLIYPKFETFNVNKTLSMSFEPAKKKYNLNQISLNLKFPYFSITSAGKKRKEMVISIPKGSSLKNLELENLSGDISVSNLNFDDVDFEVTSGDLVFEGNKIKNLNLKSSSGDVSLKNSQISSLGVKSTSGDIEFEEVSIKENFSIKTTAGDVDFIGLMKKGDIKTTAGDVNIQTDSISPDLNVSATAGDIDLHFLSTPNINIATSSLAGGITVDGESVKKNSKPVKLGLGSGNIDLATTAGNISVTTKD